MTESHRASEMMNEPSADQRRAPRRSVHAGGTLASGATTHVAWIKDLSETGICLFTNHLPEAGEKVRVTLNDDPKLPANLRKVYDGKVVRVQNSGPGAAVVAIMFSAASALFFRLA